MNNRQVALTPVSGKLFGPFFRRLFEASGTDGFKQTDARVSVLPVGLTKRVMDQVAMRHCYCTIVVFLQVVLIRLREALQPVTDHDQNVFNATAFQIQKTPVVRILRPSWPSLAQIPKDVPRSTVRRHAHDDVEPNAADLPRYGDLHYDRLNEDHQIDRIQQSRGPFGEFTGRLLDDPPADRVLRDSRPRRSRRNTRRSPVVNPHAVQ